MTDQIRVESWERAIDRRARLHQPSPRLDYRPVEDRIQDFEEACLGFTPETARQEASRCVQCPEPQACILACPLHNDIPSAIWEISQGNFIEAAHIYRKTSPFPEVCGRLCPDEFLCAGSCGVGKRFPSVRLGRLEAFVSDLQRSSEGFPLPSRISNHQPKVAIVGSGPAGLAAAEHLIRLGHPVTVFDRRSRPGGALAYDIPRFRLPIEILESKILQLERMGVSFVTSVSIGKDIQLDELLAADYRAILLATGASTEITTDLPGESLEGVFHAQEFLIRTNLTQSYHLNQPGQKTTSSLLHLKDKRVLVYGYGHAAVDSARTAIRLGAGEVICIYPGTELQMLCRQEDKLAAQEEGVLFHPLVQPIELIGNQGGHLPPENVKKVICQQMRPVRLEGQCRTIPVEGAKIAIPADMVIIGLELGPNHELTKVLDGLETDANGWIKANPVTGQTNFEAVFAAGDNTGEQHLAAFAIAEGMRVAQAIHEFLE